MEELNAALDGAPQPLGPAAAERPSVVALEADLFFGTRLADVIEAQGGRAVLAETPEEFVAAMDRWFPVLALVDLKTEGNWFEAIRRCKNRPHTRQTPLYAYGSHVDVEALKRARQAGADHAWARSRMMQELVGLVGRHLHPPVRYPEGWDAPLSAEAAKGVAAFNRGDYFEQHEHFEKAWLEEPRPIREMYQGILQVGVAFLLIERNQWLGSLKTFRRGLPRLRDLPPVCQGLNIGALRAEAEAIHAEVAALGPARLHEFDQRRFPRLEVVEEQPSRS